MATKPQPSTRSNQNDAYVAEIYTMFDHFFKAMFAKKTGRSGKQDEITHRQSRILRVLAQGPLSMGELCDRLYLHPSSVSAMVDRLEGKGFVKRQHSEEDRRRIVVSLTPLGTTQSQAAPPSVFQRVLDDLRALPEDELASIHASIQRLHGIFADAAALPDAPQMTQKPKARV